MIDTTNAEYKAAISMADERQRWEAERLSLRNTAVTLDEYNDTLEARLDAAEARIAELREALEAYNDAAVLDFLMEGPRLQGFNQSALRRAWPIGRAALERLPRE